MGGIHRWRKYGPCPQVAHNLEETKLTMKKITGKFHYDGAKEETEKTKVGGDQEQRHLEGNVGSCTARECKKRILYV